jgi:hypothetical protein
MRKLAAMGLVLLASSALGALTCEEKCQKYDYFSKTCLYETACEKNGDCMTATSCDVWDSFEAACKAELEETKCHTPNPFAGPPSCTSKCQHFDSFEGICKYQTQCIYTENDRCVTAIVCDRYDSFDKTCKTELKRTVCY